MKDMSEFHSAATTGTSQYKAFIAGVPSGLPLKSGHVFMCVVWIYGKKISKGHPCTDTEALYRPYGPQGE